MAPKRDSSVSATASVAANAAAKATASASNKSATAAGSQDPNPSVRGAPATGRTTPPTGARNTSSFTPAGAQGAGPSTPAAQIATEGKRKASQSPPSNGGPAVRRSAPVRPVAPDRLNNLRITAKEGVKIVNIEDGKNRRYALVEEIVRKALRALESSEGIDSLAKMTEALLKYWEGARLPKPTTWGNRARDLANMKKEMTAFLHRLRSDFPLIRIETARGGDAFTERFEPIGDADIVDFAKFDMERVELILPADVSTIECLLPSLPLWQELYNRILANRIKQFQQIIANIMKAEDTSLPITNYMFHMILTVCHEVIHMLVCGLSGERRPVTPKQMEVEGHVQLVGESGWWWEVTYLGGIVKMFENQTDPAAAVLLTRQPGLPLLATGNSKKSTFRRIDPRYIASFVQDSIRKLSLSPFSLNLKRAQLYTTANNYY